MSDHAPVDLKVLATREARATPGLWRSGGSGLYCGISAPPTPREPNGHGVTTYCEENDAAFIIAARNALPRHDR